jgi:hypothetical protein
VAIFAVTAVLNKKKTSGGNAAQTFTGPTLPPTAPQRVAANTDLGQVALASEQGRGTVRLTYAAQGSGIPSKITLEEMPPDELFKWPGNELVTDGKHLFSCTVAPAAACSWPGQRQALQVRDRSLQRQYLCGDHSGLAKRCEFGDPPFYGIADPACVCSPELAMYHVGL